MRYALIQNNSITQIVEQESVPTIDGTWVDVTGQNVGPGFVYNGSTFTAPVISYGTVLTKIAFRNRFTAAEKIAMYTAAKSNVEIQIYIDDIQATASGVDLADPYTIASVQSLESGTIIGTGRASAILNTPVTAAEAA